MKKRFVHVYYGDGTGKSSAATGAALRAAGNGLKTVIVRFLKSRPSGEDALLEQIESVTLLKPKGALKFLCEMNLREKEALKGEQSALLEYALFLRPDVLVLDEGIDAFCEDVLEPSLVLDCLHNGDAELFLTGHSLPDLFENADYITRFSSLAHPFSKGVSARRGIEY